MKTRLFFPRTVFAVALMLAGVLSQAATITGTVTNKTTGKPSAGDSVVLVDVGAGMAEAATATTDGKGHYSLQSPGMGAFLIRVTHQGAGYFIAAPQGSTPGDVTVYDVSPKVDGVAIDADMLLVEGSSGTLRVQERYMIRNTSNPPKAQFSEQTFEVVLPPSAVLDGASATRPGGLGTNTRLTPLSQKGHYTFNIPIQPDKGDKETVFEVQYHMPYSGKLTLSPKVVMPADHFVVYVPRGMKFSAGSGSDFQPSQDDPRVQAYIHRNLQPGQAIAFTVAGEGQMPRDQQQPAMGAQMGMGNGAGQDASVPSGPGGGIGEPINTPDPLTRYKWWILGTLALVLAGAAYFFLRNRPAPALAGFPGSARDLGHDTDSAPVFARRVETQSYAQPSASAPPQASYAASHAPTSPVSKAVLLNVLKEEMFAIESEKLAGTLSPAEYAEIKTGLEAVLKRALNKG